MQKVWALIKKDQKIIASHVEGCNHLFWQDEAELAPLLEKICLALEISQPVWLSKHTRDMKYFSRCIFNYSDFIESINFDQLELEYIID